jgi:hypothetical protein
MTKEEIGAWVSEHNDEALLADGYEDAFIGTGHRCGQPTVAVYDIGLCVKVLMERDGMDFVDALEFFQFNTLGAWAGEATPIFLQRVEGNEL